MSKSLTDNCRAYESWEHLKKKEGNPFSVCMFTFIFTARRGLNTGLVGDEAKRNVLSQLRNKRKSDLKERHNVKFGKM